MKVLVVSTSSPSMRAGIWGWDEENSDLYVRNKPIGFSPSGSSYSPNTILEALADGWKLLGPPQVEKAAKHVEFWTWWLTKES